MEFASSLRKCSHRSTTEKAVHEQWRSCSRRDRASSKPKKSRRQLFRDDSLTSKYRNDSVRITKRPSLFNMVCKKSADSKAIDSNVPMNENSECQFMLDYFHRELNRDIDSIGVERPDGTVEMIKNHKGFSQTYFHGASGPRSLNEIMTDGRSEIVEIKYKLVPVIERISVREPPHHDNGECTFYTRMKSHRDNFESLAELLDESSSMGYASQTDATASSMSLPMENDFHPIGSSTHSTEFCDDGQLNADPFTVLDMNNSLDDSQSSIYYECEATPKSDMIDRSHQM